MPPREWAPAARVDAALESATDALVQAEEARQRQTARIFSLLEPCRQPRSPNRLSGPWDGQGGLLRPVREQEQLPSRQRPGQASHSPDRGRHGSWDRPRDPRSGQVSHSPVREQDPRGYQPDVRPGQVVGYPTGPRPGQVSHSPGRGRHGPWDHLKDLQSGQASHSPVREQRDPGGYSSDLRPGPVSRSPDRERQGPWDLTPARQARRRPHLFSPLPSRCSGEAAGSPAEMADSGTPSRGCLGAPVSHSPDRGRHGSWGHLRDLRSGQTSHSPVREQRDLRGYPSDLRPQRQVSGHRPGQASHSPVREQQDCPSGAVAAAGGLPASPSAAAAGRRLLRWGGGAFDRAPSPAGVSGAGPPFASVPGLLRRSAGDSPRAPGHAPLQWMRNVPHANLFGAGALGGRSSFVGSLSSASPRGVPAACVGASAPSGHLIGAGALGGCSSFVGIVVPAACAGASASSGHIFGAGALGGCSSFVGDESSASPRVAPAACVGASASSAVPRGNPWFGVGAQGGRSCFVGSACAAGASALSANVSASSRAPPPAGGGPGFLADTPRSSGGFRGPCGAGGGPDGRESAAGAAFRGANSDGGLLSPPPRAPQLVMTPSRIAKQWPASAEPGHTQRSAPSPTAREPAVEAALRSGPGRPQDKCRESYTAKSRQPDKDDMSTCAAAAQRCRASERVHSGGSADTVSPPASVNRRTSIPPHRGCRSSTYRGQDGVPTSAPSSSAGLSSTPSQGAGRRAPAPNGIGTASGSALNSLASLRTSRVGGPEAGASGPGSKSASSASQCASDVDRGTGVQSRAASGSDLRSSSSLGRCTTASSVPGPDSDRTSLQQPDGLGAGAAREPVPIGLQAGAVLGDTINLQQPAGLQAGAVLGDTTDRHQPVVGPGAGAVLGDVTNLPHRVPKTQRSLGGKGPSTDCGGPRREAGGSASTLEPTPPPAGRRRAPDAGRGVQVPRRASFAAVAARNLLSPPVAAAGPGGGVKGGLPCAAGGGEAPEKGAGCSDTGSAPHGDGKQVGEAGRASDSVHGGVPHGDGKQEGEACRASDSVHGGVPHGDGKQEGEACRASYSIHGATPGGGREDSPEGTVAGRASEAADPLPLQKDGRLQLENQAEEEDPRHSEGIVFQNANPAHDGRDESSVHPPAQGGRLRENAADLIQEPDASSGGYDGERDAIVPKAERTGDEDAGDFNTCTNEDDVNDGDRNSERYGIPCIREAGCARDQNAGDVEGGDEDIERDGVSHSQEAGCTRDKNVDDETGQSHCAPLSSSPIRRLVHPRSSVLNPMQPASSYGDYDSMPTHRPPARTRRPRALSLSKRVFFRLAPASIVLLVLALAAGLFQQV
ncbi:hypothetical protein DIPPA_11257 [Diplonema papillatum]|nr:hypothetical protein DIPPA_11257 [Diplonema papillatum]